MQTRTLVQATADVVTVVSLRRGDVYKRLEDSPYGTERYTLLFGVVTDVLHNGEDAVINAAEFPLDYSGHPQPRLKVFGTSADLRLFVAQPEEVREHFSGVLEGSRRAVQAARDTLERAIQQDGTVQSIIGQLAGELTAPRTGSLAELEAARAAQEERLDDDDDEPLDEVTI